MCSNGRRRLGKAAFKVAVLAGVCLLLALAVRVYFVWRPPNVAACTRIEIRCVSGALGHFIPEAGILSEDEKGYLRSLDTWTVTDRVLIQAFAHSVEQGTYQGRRTDSIPPVGVEVTCYRGNRRVAFFTVYHESMRTEGLRYFTYPSGLPDLTILEPGIRPLETRRRCALHLRDLCHWGLWGTQTPPPYPDPNEWCDTIVRVLREGFVRSNGQRTRMHGEKQITGMFRCPSPHPSDDAGAADGHGYQSQPLDQTVTSRQSDYAMNPKCRLDSPPDTVLLFETKPGWNQYGGPELFTFENHDPKGGLVLLNGGDVKFIRTEGELRQLRWK